MIGVVATAVLAGAMGWVPREHVKLMDGWQVAVCRRGERPTQWRDVELPATQQGYNYVDAYYRRAFRVPERWAGRRIKLVLQGAKYCPEVFVNGRKVGEHFGGYEPCEFDITAAVRGGENELLILCHDWTVLFRGEPVKFPPRIEWHALRAYPRNRVIYPIGGRYSEFGLWDDVYLYAVPEVYIADAFVRPSVRTRTLRVDYELVNEGGAEAEVVLAARLRDRERAVLDLGRRRVAIGAGQRVRVSLQAGWREGQVELWSPERPKLYTLVSTLRSGAGVDERRDRVGLREFWCEGADFYLNGVKRHLLASSTWPLPQRTAEEIRGVLRVLKSANVICFRTHTQPWRQIWYDVADEEGLLMIPEGAVWNDDTTYRLDDPDFWRNWGRHLVGMVRALRNHPSIVMWSLENEFFGSRARAGSVYEKRLAELGRLVKREDPTRPIYFESDGDPGGVADVIGVHYPHEPPGARLWPMEAYWMDEPRPIGNTRMFWPTAEFKWDRRKPLYIGEYLWWPAGTPESYTLIYGDEAYRDLTRYRRLAKAAVWRWQTVAYRHYEVSGICPWTLFEGGPLDLRENPMMAAQAWAMQPLAAYVREELRRVYGGREVVRSLEIFNDTPGPVDAVLRWRLEAAGRRLKEGSVRLRLEAGAHMDRELRFAAPKVSEPTAGRLVLEVGVGGKRAFSEGWPLSIYPEPRQVEVRGEVALVDPAGQTAAVLGRLGVKCRKVDSWQGLGEGDVLVIGEGALNGVKGGWAAVEAGRRVAEWVRRGGRVLVLCQRAYPEGLLPARLDASARSTMAFIQARHHPVLAGLPEDALKFWAPDHIVTRGEILREARAGFVALAVTGHPDGVSHCALAELRVGRGRYLFCQVPVVERFAEEPMAAELLGRMVRYLAEAKGQAVGVEVAGGDEPYRRAVEQLVGRPRRGGEENGAHVLVMRGAEELPRGIVDWVRSGGRLVLDQPGGRAVEQLGAAVGAGLSAQAFSGPALRAEAEEPVLDLFFREDLYWVAGRTTGPAWAARELASDATEHVLAVAADFRPEIELRAEDFDVQGYLVRVSGGEVQMFTVGRARAEFEVGRDGLYAIAVEARGSACEGIYALGLVAVDGQRIGLVPTGERWRRHVLTARLRRGRHTIEVAFVNDRSRPGEDRNFFMRAVYIAPAREIGVRMVTVAEGPACAIIPLGRGEVAVNFVRWLEASTAGEKGRRFFASLLTALGAGAEPEFGVSYPAASFKPMPGLAHFRALPDGCVTMGSSGWIEGAVEVPRDGVYRIDIKAAGTKAAGHYPEVYVVVDGRDVGRFELVSGGWQWYSVQARLKAGRHAVRIMFTNDYYKPPEDRNLYLRRVRIVPVGEGG